jgi:hypothetical protein
MAYLLQLGWRDWLAIGGFGFGLVTLLAYLEQRRSARGTATLAKWAELNLDKSISEEQIRNLLVQKAVMEEQVARKIPALARTAVLQEEASLHEKSISEHFAAWQNITRELQAESLHSGLDPQLQQAILDLIFPRYTRHERRDRFRTRVTVITVALAASATVFPYPLNSAVALLLVLPLAYAGARLYALNEDPTHAFRMLQPWCHLGYAAVALAVITTGLVFAIYPHSMVGRHSGYGIMAIGLLLVVGYFPVRKFLDRLVKRLCSNSIVVALEKTSFHSDTQPSTDVNESR